MGAKPGAAEIGAQEVPHLARSRIIDPHHRKVLDTIQRSIWAWHASTENLMAARHACVRVHAPNIGPFSAK